MTDSRDYFIWSNEHRAWWRGGSAGYTTDLTQAGCYSRAEALDICTRAAYGWHDYNLPPQEIPVLAPDALICLTEQYNRLRRR